MDTQRDSRGAARISEKVVVESTTIAAWAARRDQLENSGKRDEVLAVD
jgi:hypothetical protein